MCEAASSVFSRRIGANNPDGPVVVVPAAFPAGNDDDLTTTSSILEFLQQERRCDGATADEDSELDIDSIFEEINRLSGDTRGRCVEDILREAEALISAQELGQLEVPRPVRKKTTVVKGRAVMANNLPMRKKVPTVCESGAGGGRNGDDEVVAEVLSNDDEDDECGDRGDGLVKDVDDRPEEEEAYLYESDADIELMNSSHYITASTNIHHSPVELSPHRNHETTYPAIARSSVRSNDFAFANLAASNDSSSTSRRSSKNLSTVSITETPQPSRRNSNHIQPTEDTSDARQIPTFSTPPEISATSPHTTPKYANKSTSPSPSLLAHSESMSFSRERSLEHDIEQLQETLKDTEERLHSLRLQHETLSQTHRELRDNHSHYVDEAERLKRDVQQLNECAAVLRNELQTARADREEALAVQTVVQRELDECRADRKRAVDRVDKDGRTIQDLQRQCREMERILMRKHPDSVSALIVASKNPSNGIDDQAASRRLLEQRIAQLEADAREQDTKAQQLLANVQSRFSSVQSKYEQHIGDLETQVISLQQINARLNEKIAAHLNRNHQITASQAVQTVDFAEHESTPISHATCQTDPKITGVCASVARGGVVKGGTVKSGKSESSHVHNGGKDDAHLMATLRGMRVDLAIKEKAMQRLTRDLDECKKTIRKLQRERDVTLKHGKPDHSGDPNALKDYVNKIKLLEYDYNALHSKRLQDLKTLQAAHERELVSCQETVRILQERLTERDDAFVKQKQRRQVPIDYMALKAKVSSLENRHAEREQRLHMLVDALSKGKLSGTLEGLVTSPDGHKCAHSK